MKLKLNLTRTRKPKMYKIRGLDLVCLLEPLHFQILFDKENRIRKRTHQHVEDAAGSESA